jgi:hypothetical protein
MFTASKSDDRAMLAIVFSASVLVLGYFVEAQIDYHLRRSATTLAWLSGIVLVVVGFVCQYPDGPATLANRVIAIGMLAYFTFMLAAEPLLNAVFNPPTPPGEFSHELACSLYLLPFVVASSVFMIRHRWIEAAGCLAFLYSGVVLVVFNSRATLGADGFLTRIRW